MIVDDSIIITKNLKQHFLNMSFHVAGIAKNGQEAISLYDTVKPDFVTMDITMPVLDGIEALKAIKAKHPNAKVLMVTSHGEERLVMDAISAGAKGYILKPITPVKIKDAVKKLFPEEAQAIENKILESLIGY